MNIEFIMTDNSGYKTYLELKNYLSSKNVIDKHLVNYFFIDADIDDIVLDSSLYYNFDIAKDHYMFDIIIGRDAFLADYYEKYYNIDKDGYAIARTIFLESFLIVLKNYLNNDKYLLSNLNTGEFLTTIKYRNYNDYIEFENQYDNIPEADLYILSDRNGPNNTALLTIQLSIILYLHRKYPNSKIMIGGGRNNTKNNPIANLFNAIGREYLDNKMEFCVGDIGAVIYNYIYNKEYNYSYGIAKSNILDLNITDYEMKHVLKNEFSISFSTGCTNKCPFCMDHNLSQFSMIKSPEIYKRYFLYLSNNYPDTTINIFDNELNFSATYLEKFLQLMINLNIKNTLRFFIDANKITDNILNLMSIYKNIKLSISADMINTVNKTNIINNFNQIYNRINNINIKEIDVFVVAGVPTYQTINNTDFIDIFNVCYSNISYQEFRLELSADMYINSDRYGITLLNYKNNDTAFRKIENELNSIPIMYYREDYNRKEFINQKYNLLCKLKKHLLSITCKLEPHNTLIDNLVVNCYLYNKEIVNYNNFMHKYINKYMERLRNEKNMY